MTAWCQNCNGLIAQRDQAQRDERRWRKLLLEERKARDTARAASAVAEYAGRPATTGG